MRERPHDDECNAALQSSAWFTGEAWDVSLGEGSCRRAAEGWCS